MTNLKLKTFLVVVLGFVFSSSLFSQQEINKSFDKKDIRIKLVLGNCNVVKSDNNKINVHLNYTYDDEKFEPIIREKNRYIELREKFHGDNPRGYSKWIIEVPNELDINFESATGDLILTDVDIEIDGNTGTGEIELTNSKGFFDLNTGTGRIEVIHSEGEFDLNSGTGKVIVEDSKGNFKLNSGTGKVEAIHITIEDEGDFNCGTGDVEVVAPKGTGFDLTVSSGTNDAILDMDGISLEGYFEFSAQKRRGHIDSPIKFDEEDEYEQGDQTYLRKSFTKGSDYTRFYIKTGTGKAKLKK
jgi:DUF4097 and DUF4098 domain-containing protein YvlB